MNSRLINQFFTSLQESQKDGREYCWWSLNKKVIKLKQSTCFKGETNKYKWKLREQKIMEFWVNNPYHFNQQSIPWLSEQAQKRQPPSFPSKKLQSETKRGEFSGAAAEAEVACGVRWMQCVCSEELFQRDLSSGIGEDLVGGGAGKFEVSTKEKEWKAERERKKTKLRSSSSRRKLSRRRRIKEEKEVGTPESSRIAFSQPALSLSLNLLLSSAQASALFPNLFFFESSACFFSFLHCFAFVWFAQRQMRKKMPWRRLCLQSGSEDLSFIMMCCWL